MKSRLCILLVIAFSFAAAIHAQENLGPQPKLLSAPTPVYPLEAKEAGVGGRIVARIEVDANGSVLSVGDPSVPAFHFCGSGSRGRLVRSLQDAVVESLKQAKFEPAMKDGKPVKSSINLGITFDPTEGTVGAGKKSVFKDDVLVRKALKMPKPEYPSAARPVRASGPVSVHIIVDETGGVFLAQALTGHPTLRPAAVAAACNAKFTPTIIDGQIVRASGVITYVFMP